MNRKNKNLYEQFKDTKKKLKIVCDWDEVIQTCEPYALWKTKTSEKYKQDFHSLYNGIVDFKSDFRYFWFLYEEELVKEWKEKGQDNPAYRIKESPIEYSLYGSKIKDNFFKDEDFKNKYLEIKNSPNFYQEAPFLTIAEDLLKLIEEEKVEKLIFLSAYDKRKFAEGDKRKYEIFHKTFAKLAELHKIEYDGKPYEGLHGTELSDAKLELIELQLIGFDNENQGVNKADWVKANASDFDLVIDDNPNICREVNNISAKLCLDCYKKYVENKKSFSVTCFHPRDEITVLAPYYPAVESQHDERVLLVKNEVSDLKREDFSE